MKNLKNSRIVLLWAFLLLLTPAALAAEQTEPVEITSYEQEWSRAYAVQARMGGQNGIAVVFEGTDDLHYYADPETAPAPDLNLQVTAESEKLEFGKPVFPEPKPFFDKGLNKTIPVYVGDFKVFLPVQVMKDLTKPAEAEITIKGIACTSKLCLAPFERKISASFNYNLHKTAMEIEIDQAEAENIVKDGGQSAGDFGMGYAFALAVLAGVLLNVMPCVWPIIPIIVTRIWQQAGENKAKSFSFGLAFCAGILLFFAAIAAFNIVLVIGFDTFFSWGDLLRNQGFVSFMAVLMMVLAMFMFGVFTIGVPSSVTSKASGGSGFAGMTAMGFLAALLATPCSFGILAAAVAWAQTQPLAVSTLTLMLIGAGMALPYLVLTSVPGLMNRLPKPGGWMEKIKVAMGFLLLAVAAKMLTSLRGHMLEATVYFSTATAFAVWMWGGWVSFSTPAGKKWGVRIAALILILVAGFVFYPQEKVLIEWQGYDESVINKAVENNRPVLIKFTADWCTNCTVVKKHVFEQKDTAELMEDKNVLAVEGDTTTNELPATAALKEKYNEPGVPVTVIHKPGGETVKLRGIFDKQELIEILKSLP